MINRVVTTIAHSLLGTATLDGRLTADRPPAYVPPPPPRPRPAPPPTPKPWDGQWTGPRPSTLAEEIAELQRQHVARWTAAPAEDDASPDEMVVPWVQP